ncbi:hypothetical protein ACKA04_04270 [Helcococcus kunzii]|uniref:hypothetical protein n=1 Tax=Helcococcus kunzii TaxID=40091 RepID=UPI0038A516C8
MKTKKYVLSTLLLFGLLIISFVNVDASRGKLSFYHGRRDIRATARIESTRTEGSMKIDMYMTFDKGTSDFLTKKGYDISRLSLESYTNRDSGTSTCHYFVNNRFEHESTAPYRFK